MNLLLLRTKKLCWHETDEEMAEEASYEETDSINRNCYLHGYVNDNYKRKRTWSQSKSLFLDRLKVQLPLNCVFIKSLWNAPFARGFAYYRGVRGYPFCVLDGHDYVAGGRIAQWDQIALDGFALHLYAFCRASAYRDVVARTAE